MKILIVHNHYRQHGGEQVAVEAQIALLRKRGHRVILYIRDNTEIERNGLWQKATFPFETIFSWRTYREIQTLVSSENPDVAHIHNVFHRISPAVYRALKKTDVPIVQTVHNFRFLCPNALFYTHGRICERCKYGNTLYAVRWRCYRQSYILSALYGFAIGLHRRYGTFDLIDRFIALTEFTAQKLIESGLVPRDKISVLGNFLPDPLPRLGSFERREPYLVYLGRLSSEKGIDVLLDAIADWPKMELKIAGDGPQGETLRAKARQQGSRVEFLGYVAGEKKWELLRDAMATIVPSVCYEAFPLTPLESMAVGTPVIASNLGSLPYVVKDGKSGLLFYPGRSRDLQQKLAWLVAHSKEALAMGQFGRRMVEANYSAGIYYDQLMSIYSVMK
ncbi:MAG: glycosyltransferase family 4 protein [Anaerolineales bacterium]|nr:glycosyltransferase family 4 protein [Anaerolineales bacterium]